MSKIKILPENLANQIAAGEVVERPASVVKEFVENSIDAGAENISIEVEGDGSRLLRVIDDGCGMDEDDVLLCLERHATSKLLNAEQLFQINTLGFRGEAIPSIASVSRFTITSRHRDSVLGTRAEVKFGKICKVHEMGCAFGTVMEVKNLFSNLPARKKFLKSKQTELSHIDEVIKNYALVHPEIGFRYQVQGKTVLDLESGTEKTAERVKKIIAPALADDLLAFGNGGEESDGISVHGYLVPPEISGSGKLRAFVNGRMVKDKMISQAVSEGMHGFLLKGRRAWGTIFVSLPLESVDVNVHPTKQEVRFRRSNLVYSAIVQSIRTGLEKYQDTLRHAVFGASGSHKEKGEVGGQGVIIQPETVAARPPVIDSDVADPQEKITGADVCAAEKLQQEQEVKKEGSKKNIPDECANNSLLLKTTPGSRESSRGKEKENDLDFVAPFSHETFANEQPVCEPQSAPGYETELPGLSVKSQTHEPIVAEAECVSQQKGASEVSGSPKYLGQIFNGYLLCESGESLVVVDQHAAQERLIYEELLEQYARGEIPSQILLFPEVVELGVQDMQIVDQYSEEICQLGLDIAEFGGDSFLIKAVPATLSHLGAVEILRGLLSHFENDSRKGAKGRRLENVLAGMACKAAIKAGQQLLPEEADALIEQMMQAGVFSHCPHGRPVVRAFSRGEVEKWFLRT